MSRGKFTVGKPPRSGKYRTRLTDGTVKVNRYDALSGWENYVGQVIAWSEIIRAKNLT